MKFLTKIYKFYTSGIKTLWSLLFTKPSQLAAIAEKMLKDTKGIELTKDEMRERLLRDYAKQ